MTPPGESVPMPQFTASGAHHLLPLRLFLELGPKMPFSGQAADRIPSTAVSYSRRAFRSDPAGCEEGDVFAPGTARLFCRMLQP